MPALAKLGLIGAGRWGKNIIRTINEMPNSNLVKLVSSNINSVSLVSEDCTITSDWKDILIKEEIDGVIIATPPKTHAYIALAAIEAGIPVMVEKPLTMNLQEAKKIEEASIKKSVPILVDHIHIHHPTYQILKSLIKKHGEIKEISSVGGNYGPFNNVPPLWDWGAHDVSICLDLLGLDCRIMNVKRVDVSEKKYEEGEVIQLEMISNNNTKGKLLFGNIMPNKTRCLTVECENGKIIFDDVKKSLTVENKEGVFEKLFPSISPLHYVLTIFENGILNKDYKQFGVSIGVRVTELLSQAYLELYGTTGGS